ncbi:MAG: hypothetical protein K2P85_04560 [Flavobacteriaceae bacterium]|nr:hypothetical protein [Flavobacteriaceae bacterium]
MKFNLQENNGILTIDFYFNKTFTYVYLTVSAIIISFIFIKLKTPIYDNLPSIILGIFLLGYLSLVDYFEWKKHRKHTLRFENELLYINEIEINPERIAAIYIEYINSHIQGGYRIYIDSLIEKDKYIFKERLSKNDSIKVAYLINQMLNKDIIILKSWNRKEIIFKS